MANRFAEPYYAGGLPQLLLGGAALLAGAVNLAESLTLHSGRVALSPAEWLATICTFAIGAYWPFRGGLEAAPDASGVRRFAPLGLLLGVAVAFFAVAIVGGLLGHQGAPVLPQIVLAAGCGAGLAALAWIWRIRALALYAAVIAAAASLFVILAASGPQVGAGLPLLAGCLLAGDGTLRRMRRHAPTPPRPVALPATLPGAGVRAVRTAGRRGMEVWFEDGSPELQLGATMIACGLFYLLLGAPLPGSVAGLGALAGQFLLLAVIGLLTVASRWFKERVTAARSGSVRPRPPRAAMAVLAVAIAVLLAAGIAWPPLFGDRSANVEAIVLPFLPFLTGVLFGGLAAWAAWISGLGALYRAAAGALVLGLLLSFSGVRGFTGAGVVALCAGLFTVGDGALRMRRYLRSTSP